MKEDHLTLHDRERNLIVKATRSANRLYKVFMDIVNYECHQLTAQSDYSRWHARLGHIGASTLQTMVKKQLVTGIPNISIEKETCASCLLGKQTRHPFPNTATYRAIHKLELIHGDLCGPITPPTAGKSRYIFVLIDDFSRYMWTVLLQEKSEAFEKFKKFKSMVEGETGERIKTFRTDRGENLPLASSRGSAKQLESIDI